MSRIIHIINIAKSCRWLKPRGILSMLIAFTMIFDLLSPAANTIAIYAAANHPASTTFEVEDSNNAENLNDTDNNDNPENTNKKKEKKNSKEEKSQTEESQVQESQVEKKDKSNKKKKEDSNTPKEETTQSSKKDEETSEEAETESRKEETTTAAEKETTTEAETETTKEAETEASTESTTESDKDEEETSSKEETKSSKRKKKSSTKEETTAAPKAAAGEIVYETTDYTITAKYGKKAGLPADVQLRVKEVFPQTEEEKKKKVKLTSLLSYEDYTNYADQALKDKKKNKKAGRKVQAGEWATSRIFEITFISGDKELTPTAPVTFTFEWSKDKKKEIKKELKNSDITYDAIYFVSNEAFPIKGNASNLAKVKEEGITALGILTYRPIPETTAAEETTTEESTAVKETAVEETVIEEIVETTAVEEAPEEDEMPEVDEMPVVEETSAVEESTVTEENTETENTTALEETSAVEETMVLEETAAVEETTVLEETTAIEETNEAKESSEAEESSELEETPIVEEISEPEETTAVEENSDREETPKVEETPEAEETTAIEETPAVDEMPEIEETTLAEETSSVEETSGAEETNAVEGTSEEETSAVEETSEEETSAVEETAVVEETSSIEETSAEDDSHKETTHTLEYKARTFTVTLTYDNQAGIPEDAVLRVRELKKYSNQYKSYLADAEDLLENPILYIRMLDIGIYSGDERIEPQSNVSVNVILNKTVEEENDLHILEFSNEKVEELEAETPAENLNDTIEIGSKIDSSPDMSNPGPLQNTSEGTKVKNSKDNSDTAVTADTAEEFSFSATPSSVYAFIGTKIERIITTSDGKTYRITLTCDGTAGIPEDTILAVTEIHENTSEYDKYVSNSANALGESTDNISMARAFDITLLDPDTGKEFQPEQDVKVSIELLDTGLNSDAQIDVVHFGKDTEVLESEVNGSAVEFDTGSFSVYVIIEHEGGEIFTPRVEFHFLGSDYTETVTNDGVDYSAGLFSFVNKANETQSSQILKNGESLEMISNPANLIIDNEDGTVTSKYFYGWYIVDESFADEQSGQVTYRWTEEPEQLSFEKPISITPTWADAAHTVVSAITWTLNGMEHTSQNIDALGCAHVYVAPIFEDYYFVNFHTGTIDDTNLSQSIMARKLAVLGSDEKGWIRIGDIQAPSSDALHRIFTGWEGELYQTDAGEIAHTTMTTIDDDGTEIVSEEGFDGYYIEVHSQDFETTRTIDLYPIFTEARWIYFNLGTLPNGTPNGASYVGAKFVYTNEDATLDKYFVTDLPVSSRAGFQFKGWVADPATKDANGDWIDGVQITDENGQVVDGPYTKLADDGVTPLYQIKEGKLYVYKALPSEGLPLYARWEEKNETDITVIVWEQKITDDKDAEDEDKTYDFVSANTVHTTSGLTLADLRTNNVLNAYESNAKTGFHYRTTKMSTRATAGDGSTVVNVYFDRNLITINFYYDGTGEPAYTYTETSAESGQLYGVVNGEYVLLEKREGSGYQWQLAESYEATASDTIPIQYGLTAGNENTGKDYVQLERISNTISNTRWRYYTGRNGTTQRYMDQGRTDGDLYIKTGTRTIWLPFIGRITYDVYAKSGYTMDNPPPENDRTEYYCLDNNQYYRVNRVTTTTTTYTWSYNGTEWTGIRYYKLASSDVYDGTRYTRIGSVSPYNYTETEDNYGTQYGIDAKGGHVLLARVQIARSEWYAQKTLNQYYVDNENDGSAGDVYGLVDGQYVKLTPNYGDEYTYSTEYTYTPTNDDYEAQATQYGIVDDEYVPLNYTVVGQASGYNVTYIYTPVTAADEGAQVNNYYYINSTTMTRANSLYYHNGTWYQMRYLTLSGYTYYNQVTGAAYSLQYGDGYYWPSSEPIYRLKNGEFENYSGNGTRFALGENGEIYQLGNIGQYPTYGWSANGSNEYTGTRYLQNNGTAYTGQRLRRSGSGAPYTYTPTADDGDGLFMVDENNGHVALISRAAVVGYTYEDDRGTHNYSGDRYSYGPVTVEALYTGPRFTRSANAFNNMMVFTGLYGQSLEQNGYIWPAEYWWYDNFSTRSGEKYGTGTRTTFLDAFLPTNEGNNLVFYGFESTGSNAIRFYKETLDGDFVLANTVYTSNGGNFNISDKYDGFIAYQYSTNGTTWNSVGNKGSNGYYNNGNSVSYTNTLYIRFKRNPYTLTFDYNYPNVAGMTIGGVDIETYTETNSTSAQKTLLFEQSMSEYGEGGVSYFEPTAPDNYVFMGWYADEVWKYNSTPDEGNSFNFNSIMPSANMVVYAKYRPVKFPVRIDPNGAQIDHINHAVGAYPSSVTPFRVSEGESYNSSQSTQFNADFHETIGEYELTRNYVEISDVAAKELDAGEVFYYMNAQYDPEFDGPGLPPDLRNALYLTEDELEGYYAFYKSLIEYNGRINGSKYGGFDVNDNGSVTVKLGFDAWKDKYLAKNSNGGLQKYRKTSGEEYYTFLGWYSLDNLGRPSVMPYDFADLVEDEITLRAYWRLDGGYTLHYVPEYTMPDGTIINGAMEAWNDPEMSEASYADQANTHVYRQPNNITANGRPTEDYIFRGWRKVVPKTVGTEVRYTALEDNVFYDPGDNFTIRAEDAINSVIYIQAVYEYKDSAYRRPDVANLTLNANSGYVVGADGEMLTDIVVADWDDVGTLTMDADTLAFGNIQSNAEVRLYRYATDLTHVDGDETKAALDPTGNNLFKHDDGHFLLGFDDAADEGDYVATYPADSVIAVQRRDTRTIYAVWEPMVYLTFVNDTGVGDVTFGLSSSEGALQVVNAMEGLYGRTPLSVAEMNGITVKDGETLTLAVPFGIVKDGDEWIGRHITVSGTNTLGSGYLLSAKSELNGEERVMEGSLTGGRADYFNVQNTKSFGFTDMLVRDEKGIIVTFTAVQNPHTLVLNDNYEGAIEREVYFNETEDGFVYLDDETDGTYGLPQTNTRIGYEFLGWSEDRTATEPEYTVGKWTITDLKAFFGEESLKTLYAVWRENLEASTVYVYKTVPEPGDKEKPFRFTVNFSGTYTDKKKSFGWRETSNQSFKLNNAGAFDLTDGQYLKIVVSNTQVEALGEVTLVVGKYNADNTQVGSDSRLQWSKPYTDTNSQKFTSIDQILITVEEDDYTDQYYDTDVKTIVQTQKPLTAAGSMLSWSDFDAGGTAIFTNTRQTADVEVKKTLNSNTSAAGVFNFTASYTLDGETVTLEPFTVTSGETVTKLEKLPVGAALTLKEQKDEDYITDAASSVGSFDTNENAYTLTIPRDGATVTYTNTLKSFPVKFVLVDQDGQTGIQGSFTLSGDHSNVFTRRYNNVNTGVIYESGRDADKPLYVGNYTLNQIFTQTKYLGLLDGATINVTKDGVYVPEGTENVSVKQEGDVYVITVTNRATADVEISKTLVDPLVRSRSFGFTASYTLDDNVSSLPAFSVISGESYTINVPVGSTLTVTEALSEADAPLYDVAIDGTLSATRTYTAEIDTNEDKTVEFTNTRKTGDLEISKTVDSKLTEDLTADYAFTVILNSAFLSGTYGGIEFVNGEGSFELANGKSKLIEGLPAGVGYTVTEAENSSFEVKKTGDTGMISNTKSVATFTNTRKIATVTIEKTVGEDALATDKAREFEFTAIITDAKGDTVEEYPGETFTLKDSGTKAIEVPVGMKLTIAEAASQTVIGDLVLSDVYDTSTASDQFTDSDDDATVFTIDEVGESGTVTFANVRKYQDVTVNKTLNDPLVETAKFYFTGVVMDGETDISTSIGALKDGFDIDSGESTILSLPVGVTFTVTEDTDAQILQDSEDKVSDIYETEYENTPLTVSSDITQNIITVTNTRKTGDLVVKKVFQGTDSQLQNTEFVFRVELSDKSIGDIEGKTFGGMTFSKGIATFRLKNGQSITGEDLPYGIGVKVEEYGMWDADSAREVALDRFLTDIACEATDSGTNVVEQNTVYTVNKSERSLDFEHLEDDRLIITFTNSRPIARVSKDGGTTWEYFDALVDIKSGDEITVPGAFNYAEKQDETVIIETLLENDERYKLPQNGVTFAKNHSVTLRTTQDEFWNKEGFITTITRGLNGGSMLTLTGGMLTLEQITLDGGAVVDDAGNNTGLLTAANGGIVNVHEGAGLTLVDGATLQSSVTSGNGGAVYVARGATVTMTGGNIESNIAANGAGIYLEEGSRLELSGKPGFNNNIVKLTDYADKTNGGEKVYTNDRVQQDIFLAGYSNAEATSIVVTAPLANPNSEGDDGWIWVWAEEQEHHEMLTQFAKFTGDTIDEATLHAFRNAQDDEATGCGGDYLTGQEGEVTGCIYWTGGFTFAFRKIKSDGDPLNGAKFTLYTTVKSDGKLVPVKKGSKDTPINDLDAVKLDVSTWNEVKGEATATSKQIDSVIIKAYNEGRKPQDRIISGNGLVEFDKIPPGNYFMVETTTTENWEPLYDVYRVYLDGSGWISISGVARDNNGKLNWPVAANPTKPADTPVVPFVKGDDGKYSWTESVPEGAETISVFNIMNISTLKRKVILRKVEKDTNSSLKGAVFEILRADRTLISSTDLNGNTVTHFTSGDNGVYFIDKLPFGTYYIHETTTPGGYKFLSDGTNWYTLTVNKDGISVSERLSEAP